MSELQLKISEEIDRLCPPLDNETYDAMKRDIELKGIQTDLFVSKGTPGIEDGVILCGNTRYKIAKELNIPDVNIPYKTKTFRFKEEAIEFALKDNILRRQLDEWQKCEIIKNRKEFAQSVMKLRMQQSQGRPPSHLKKGNI